MQAIWVDIDMIFGGNMKLHSHWKAVFTAMAKALPSPTNYDAIEAVLKKQGKASSRRPNLRRHILSYVDNEYLERVRDGYFRPTEKGLKAAGVRTKYLASLPPKDEAPDSSEPSASASPGNGRGDPSSFEGLETADTSH